MTTQAPTAEEVEALVARLGKCSIESHVGIGTKDWRSWDGKASVPCDLLRRVEDCLRRLAAVPPSETLVDAEMWRGMTITATKLEEVIGVHLTFTREAVVGYCDQGREKGAERVVEIALDLDGQRIEMTYDEFKARLTAPQHPPAPLPGTLPNNFGKLMAKVSDPPAPLTFDAFRKANVTRCVKWHPQGIESWSPSDWLTAVTGELGELASLLKMRNRERDGLPGNKFSPTDKQVADEIADVLTYLDLLAAALGVDLGKAAAEKFNEVSERVGFPDRIDAALREPAQERK